MKRRSLSLFLALILVLFSLLSAGCAKDNSVKDEPCQSEHLTESTTPDESILSPLLYKVTDKNDNILWLFGSIHVGTEDFYPLPDYVLDAMDESDSLAVEADIVAFETDFAQQLKALIQLVYTDGTKINDVITEELYNESVEILKESGLYVSHLDMYMPILWSNFIDNAAIIKTGVNAELGIDRHLINRAKEKGLSIKEIESAVFQYGMLAGFSTELQVTLLEASVEAYKDPEANKNDMNELIDLWARGDEARLTEELTAPAEAESPEEEKLCDEYNYAMLTARNKSMTEFAEDSLSSGETVFICVGAAHLVGGDGIVNSLRSLGYTVEIVKQSLIFVAVQQKNALIFGNFY